MLLKTALLGTVRYPLTPDLRQQAAAFDIDTTREDAEIVLALAAIQHRLNRAAIVLPRYEGALPQPIDAHETLKHCVSPIRSRGYPTQLSKSPHLG